MAKNRKVEIFTAGCCVCDGAVELVKSTACPSCDVKVYDLNAKCATNECVDKAKKYGIKSLPAVVIDGELADCCNSDGINISTLKAIGLGQTI